MFETSRTTSNVVFLMSYVVFEKCGSVFEMCADGVSQKRKRNMLPPPIYNLGPPSDDLEAVFGLLQLYENQRPAEGQNYV